MQEVREVPARNPTFKVFTGVVISKELHAHDSKDEDDDGENKTEVAEGTHGSAYDANEQVESGPRFGQLKHT